PGPYMQASSCRARPLGGVPSTRFAEPKVQARTSRVPCTDRRGIGKEGHRPAQLWIRETRHRSGLVGAPLLPAPDPPPLRLDRQEILTTISLPNTRPHPNRAAR